MYIRGKGGKVVAILGINYDISSLLMVESAVRELTAAGDSTQTEPEKIINVNDVLDELIAQSVALVGKARGADEQGGQDARHRLFEPERCIPRHQVRRQGRQIFRNFKIYTLFLH